MRKKRILYVVNNLAFFISHRLELGRRAKEEGWDVHVAAPTATEESRAATKEFTVHTIRMRRSALSLWEEALTFYDFLRLYHQLRPDVVHLVGLKPILHGAIAARVARVPRVVAAVTGLGYLFIAQELPARLLRSAVSAFLRGILRTPGFVTLFQNPDDQAAIFGPTEKSRRGIVIIKGAGVDLSRFRPSPEADGEPMIVLVGRMLWHKGVREFVDAAGILRRAGVRARFVLVGDVDHANPAGVPEALLRRWTNEGLVEWWGQRKDVSEIIRNSHVVCLPSYREGTPKSLLEAAASGRAIVTTDCPGCREVVRHGDNGFLVPVGNEVELAKAIRQLVEDAGLRKSMGNRGRAIAEEEFGLDRVIQSTLRLYDSVA